MAFTSCLTEIAGNIQDDCNKPIVGGYTGRAVLIPYSINPAFVQDADNPRIVSAITIPEGQKVVGVDNVFAEPFTGSNTASAADSGRAMFTKTVAIRIPRRGAAASKDLVEPLLNSAEGFAMVLEKKDKAGDGSFEIVGLLQPLKAQADSITRNELENGGNWGVTLSCTEIWGEVVLFDDDYATSKAAFNALLDKAY